MLTLRQADSPTVKWLEGESERLLAVQRKLLDELGSYGEGVAGLPSGKHAVGYDGGRYVLYSNRSACLAALKEYDGALRDGRRCVRLQPDWPKGHGRCAAALLGKGDVPGAQAAAERGLELDATNANLIAVRDACLARCLEDAAIGA